MGKYLEAAQKIRAVMDTAAGMLTDEQALKVTAHTAQAAWTPTDAHSLWAKVLTDPSGEILPWVQPDSTNPYAKGDKVTHNGKTWESLVDNNVWEPGAVGTESLWKEVAA